LPHHALLVRKHGHPDLPFTRVRRLYPPAAARLNRAGGAITSPNRGIWWRFDDAR
jgi:hypothetical protein